MATPPLTEIFTDLPGRVEARLTKTRRIRRIAVDPTTLEILEGEWARAEAEACGVGVQLAVDI